MKKPFAKVGALSNAMLVKLLMEGTYTMQELAEETGLHYQTILEHTRAMHKIGIIYISQWEKDSRGRDAIRIFKFGVGKDVKRTRLAASERQAMCRAKKKQAQLNTVLGGQGAYVQAGNGRLRYEVRS